MTIMIKAVIFDLDGTLLHTRDDIGSALNRSLSALGYPTHELEEYNCIIGGGIMDAIKKAAPRDTSTEELIKINQLYQKDYPKNSAVLSEPFDGVLELLELLRGRGIALAVYTNKTEATAQKLTKHFFPGTDFKFVWGNDGKRPLKPDPGAGAEASIIFGLPASEIAFVGDGGTDMGFAKNSGFLAVGALWGYRDSEELISTGADRLFETPLDVAAII